MHNGLRTQSAFILAGLLAWPGVLWSQPPPGPDSEKPEASDSEKPEAGSDPSSGNEPVRVDPIDVKAGRESAGGVRALTSDDPRARDAERGLDEPVFVTRIHIDERAGETVSTAEALAESVGAHARSLGGLGSFSSISIRGAASGHTTVLIDGVPLSRIASVTADLGRISLESYSSLELYRGGVPAELGGQTLGGALNLKSAIGPSPGGKTLVLSAGAGSFGSRHLRASWRGGRADGTTGFHLGLGYAGATGDFEYFNDNGTNLVAEDDVLEPRQNNGYDQLDAAARYRLRRGYLTIEAGSRSLFKSQGIPGSARVQSQSAGLTTFSQLLDLQLSKQSLWGSPRLFGTAQAYGLFEWQHFQDLDGEIGLGTQDRRHRSLSGGAAGRVSADLGDMHNLSVGLETRTDYFTENDALVEPDDSLRSHGWRTGGAVTLTDDISLGQLDGWVFQPAFRIDWLRTVPIADSSQPAVDEGQLATRNDVFLSPRLAYRARVTRGLSIKGSVGRYFRAPTVMELYGDRGFVVGNPDLRAETGISGDIGLVWAPAPFQPGAAHGGSGSIGDPRHFVDRIYIEASAFARRPRDTIAFVTSMGLAARAQNLGDTMIQGLETGLSLRLAKTATFSGNYTFLSTRQDSPLLSFDGKPLPHRPRHQVYGRVDVARQVRGHLVVVWSDVSFTTGNFLDQAGLSQVPTRQFFGAGLKVEPMPGLLIGLEGKNLANERIETIALDPPPRPDLARIPRAVADFFGYPLPGRAFYLTAQWAH